MLFDDLFHLHHIIPSIKFVATFFETSDQIVSHVFVEIHAVKGQVFIFTFRRYTDAGIEVCDIHIFLCRSYAFIQQSACAVSVIVIVYIYADLSRIVISCSVYERPCICVSYYTIIFSITIYGYFFRVFLILLFTAFSALVLKG